MARYKGGKPNPQVYRVCAVCGKRHGVTYGFRGTLAANGIKGDKAVPSCVAKLRGAVMKRDRVAAAPAGQD